MADAFTDLMIAHKLEEIREEIREELTGLAGQPGPEGPVGPPGPPGNPAPPAMSPISGAYAILNPGSSASNAFVPQVGHAYTTPAYLSAATDITELWTNVVTAAAGSTMQLGYYTNQGSTFTRQAVFGTIDCSTTGGKILAGGWTLPAGIIWLAWICFGAAPTMRGTSGSVMVPPPHLSSTIIGDPTQDMRTMYVGGPQASLPASFTSTAMGMTSNPVRFAGKWA